MSWHGIDQDGCSLGWMKYLLHMCYLQFGIGHLAVSLAQSVPRVHTVRDYSCRDTLWVYVHVDEYMEATIYYRCMQMSTCEFSMLRKWTVQRHVSYGVITIMLVPVQWVYVRIATLWVHHCAGAVLPSTGQG